MIDRRALLILPALAVVGVFFLYPVGVLLMRSVTDPVWSLHSYRTIITQTLYARALWNTVEISASVMLICLAIGYPFAYAIAQAGERVRTLLIFAVLVPFWSSILVRTFAWMVLLQRRGLINQTLLWLGLIDAPLELTHNRIGVLVGMSHVLLPFMVLPLYAVMARIDASYMRAAASLGAPPWRSFLRVYLPLTRPGLLNGMALVFVLALGYFIVPALLGGPGDTMIAQIIQSQIADFGDWSVAGALAVALMAAVGLSFAIVRRAITPLSRA